MLIIGSAGPLVHKDARATQTNGRSWEKIAGQDGRRSYAHPCGNSLWRESPF
jgi:hypothetical protein